VILLAASLVSILAVSRATGNTISVTEADNGRTVTLASGDTLMVSLGSTPGTGFGWKVAKVDRKVLKETGKPELIHSPNPMPGAPATQRFRFVVSGEGTTRLELEYVRPWERGVPPARTFHLGVTVR
jgi:inhibitor of cysteine peptidase